MIPIFEWSLWQHGVRAELASQWADTRNVKIRDKGLTERIRVSLALYPCDLLFIHRDAEGAAYQLREVEIQQAASMVEDCPPFVAMIPVRMLEAWLLVSESAIRIASGNPHGNVQLSLPRVPQIEGFADPKEELFTLLRRASERRGRKLDQFDVSFARTLVSQNIKDFQTLRMLPSFVKFEAELDQVIGTHHFRNWA